MPVYMDTHEGQTDLPKDLRSLVEKRVRSGERDAFGVIDRGVIIDKQAGKLHCVLDAPDEAAVIRHHEALKVPIEHETIHRAEIIFK